MPDNQTRKADGTTAVPTEPNPTQVTTADGKWTFEGYMEQYKKAFQKYFEKMKK